MTDTIWTLCTPQGWKLQGTNAGNDIGSIIIGHINNFSLLKLHGHQLSQAFIVRVRLYCLKIFYTAQLAKVLWSWYEKSMELSNEEVRVIQGKWIFEIWDRSNPYGEPRTGKQMLVGESPSLPQVTKYCQPLIFTGWWFMDDGKTERPFLELMPI